MIRRVLCWLGHHAGACTDGAYRCDFCSYVDWYDYDDAQEYGGNARGLSIEEYDDLLGQFAEYRRKNHEEFYVSPLP